MTVVKEEIRAMFISVLVPCTLNLLRKVINVYYWPKVSIVRFVELYGKIEPYGFQPATAWLKFEVYEKADLVA